MNAPTTGTADDFPFKPEFNGTVQDGIGRQLASTVSPKKEFDPQRRW
jgi:hypothetical protein